MFGQFEPRTGATLTNGTVLAGPYSTGGTGGGQPTTGTTFTLTSGADTLTPTSATAALKTTEGNDVFRAVTNGDLGTADFINGGGGIDTINATATFSATPAAVTPELTSVEIVNLTASGGTADGDSYSFSGAKSTGLQQVWLVNSVGNAATAETSNVVVGGITTAVTVGIEGGSKGGTGATNLNSGLTVNFTNVTGTADTANLALKGAAANVVTIAGVETLNVATSSTASTIATLTAAQLTTLNVTGASDLTITNGIDFADATDTTAIDGTINASTFTGKLNVTVGGTGDNVSVIGGTNNDRIAFATGEFTAADKVDGGAGTDTLAISAANAVTISGLSAADAAKFQVANIERLAISTATANGNVIDLDRFSVRNYVDFEAAATATTTLNNLANNGTVELSAAANGLTVNVKDAATAGNTTDVFNLVLNAAATGGTVDFGAVTAANVETININSTSTTASSSLVAADKNEIDLTVANAQKIVVTGNVYADLDGAALTGGALGSIDATGNTAGVAVSTTGATQGIKFDLTSKADVVVGGAGADIINAGAGNDTVTGGNGIDQIDLGTGDDIVSLSGIVSSANRDVITNFTANGTAPAAGNGVDVIQVAASDTSATTAATSAPVFSEVGAKAASFTFNGTSQEIVEFTFDVGASADLSAATNGSELLKGISSTATAATLTANAVTDKGYFVAYDNGDAFVYYVNANGDGGNSTTITADEIQLVAQVKNVAVGGLAVGNFDLI